MVSISLFIELLRGRPLWLFWAMVAAQAVLWTAVPALFYSAPPGQLPLVLAVGHEFAMGTEFGPPLAFWLAEIVYRAAGMFGVYLLSQLCAVTTPETLGWGFFVHCSSGSSQTDGLARQVARRLSWSLGSRNAPTQQPTHRHAQSAGPSAHLVTVQSSCAVLNRTNVPIFEDSVGHRHARSSSPP